MSKGLARRKFSKEFKREAVKLSDREDLTIPQAAENLGIPLKLLYRWRYELKQHGDDAFRGHGQRTSEQEELARLRRENETLRMERDILKKAAAWFAKQQL
jgi:transposase